MTAPKPSPERGGCDHKFIDSAHCIKCGWVPPKTTRIGIVPAEPVAEAELTADDRPADLRKEVLWGYYWAAVEMFGADPDIESASAEFNERFGWCGFMAAETDPPLNEEEQPSVR